MKEVTKDKEFCKWEYDFKFEFAKSNCGFLDIARGYLFGNQSDMIIVYSRFQENLKKISKNFENRMKIRASKLLVINT